MTKAAFALPLITAALGLSASAAPAAAQQAEPAYTSEQCRAAVGILAETEGRDEDAAAIALSEACEAHRRAYAFDVSDDMERMQARLREAGIDYESGLTDRILDCERRTEMVMLETVPEGEPAPDREEVLGSCTANAQMALYAAAIVQLNEAERSRAATAQREYEAAMAAREAEITQKAREHQRAVEAAAMAHEREMADWRRRVELCESGEMEYCQPE
ncbi:hypothetical protein [Alteraurantiacibacter aquimixticola]|uniref:DUF1311 domain-containing protein n=1 Tax=Alteraurantiacibacter aquimixticola TaxID=2489173 RepID=A0A4T3F2G5_9SPHN|nr:hypothetical protein [Alteraurantiacibacter aquimixticola]TIX50270.1 hypothetical protein E5222_08265 [Alteraurantiacibacter aquimixticola]